jgi:hypothetical protein
MVPRCSVPKWEEFGYTPAVFARVASKGLAVYGTWKNVRKLEVAEEKEGNGKTGGVAPLCFSQEYDSMGVRGWGSAKNIIRKELVSLRDLVEIDG